MADLEEHTGSRTRNLRVDLIGGDLKYRFVLFNRIAHILKPLGNGPFSNRFAHLGHHQFNAHLPDSYI